MSRQLQPPQEGSLSWEEKQSVQQPPCCWALGQACSATSSLETSSQDCTQQTKGCPSHCWAPTLLPPCHYIQSRQKWQLSSLLAGSCAPHSAAARQVS